MTFSTKTNSRGTHTQHPTWIRAYLGAAESLKRKQTQEVTQFTQLSHLVIAELQLGLGASQFSTLYSSQKKKRGGWEGQYQVAGLLRFQSLQTQDKVPQVYTLQDIPMMTKV